MDDLLGFEEQAILRVYSAEVLGVDAALAFLVDNILVVEVLDGAKVVLYVSKRNCRFRMVGSA